MKQKGPKLILHFDVNKTIILSDKAQGLTKDDVVPLLSMTQRVLFLYLMRCEDEGDGREVLMGATGGNC